MKLILRCIAILLFTSCVAMAQEAQHAYKIKGRLLEKSKLRRPANVEIGIPELNLKVYTNYEGKFELGVDKEGRYNVTIRGFMADDTLSVNVNAPLIDLGRISVNLFDDEGSAGKTDIPTIAIEDNNASSSDDGVQTQNISGMLSSGRDPFVNAASFSFGQFWFRPRGYDRNQQEVYINGIAINDVETGDAVWNQLGGLNDVFRNRTNIYGLQPSGYAFGGLNGSTFFDATAANQRKQIRVSYAISNRNYRNRLMATYSSGLMKNGWAYSVSVSKRWAKEGYVPGTFYDGYSYYASASKVYRKHQFDITAYGTPTRRGKFSFGTQEAYDLAGTHYYNSNWGMQEGEKRNSRVNDLFQPVFILSHQYKPSEKTRLSTSLAYQFGKNKNSSIDWLNAGDPRPDYYRNLPSYYQNAIPPDPVTAAAVENQITSNPEILQLNWGRMYNANYINRETINNVNGIAGNDVTGNRSLYVLSNDVESIKKWSFNTNLEHTINDHFTLNAGINFNAQRTENYRQLADLMGGDFFLNFNQFAARQYVGNAQYYQNDLNAPNRLVYEGDKYGYDYVSKFYKGYVWGQAVGSFKKVDFFLSANAGINSFGRDGLYRNGLFANNSFGESKMQQFLTYAAKGGATYKLNGRHYLFVNGGYWADAPTFDNTYISPRTRDFTIDNPELQRTQTIEGGYTYRAPKLNIRAVVYATDMKNVSEIKRFYNDDPSYLTFVNYAMQGINMRFTGTELAVNAVLTSSLDVTVAAALGQAFYTNNPKVSIYKDNDTTTLTAGKREVYLKDLYVAAGPQSLYTLGVHYRSKHYWNLNANFNYVDRNYVDVNPDRRSSEAADLITPNSALWHQIFDQEKLPSAFTIDLSGGYSWQLKHLSKKFGKSMIYIYAGVNNLLNNTNIVNAGFEQLRYDFSNNNAVKFPNKYSYGYGRNYFVNLSLKF